MKRATVLAVSAIVLGMQPTSAGAQANGSLKGKDGDSVVATGRPPNKKATSKVVAPLPKQRPPVVMVADAVAQIRNCSGEFVVQTTVNSPFWMNPNDSAKVRMRQSTNPADSRGVSRLWITPSNFTLTPTGPQTITVRGTRNATPAQSSCRKGYVTIEPVVSWSGVIKGTPISRNGPHMSGEIKLPPFPLVVYSTLGQQGVPTTPKGTVFDRTIGVLCCNPGPYTLQLVPDKNMKFVNFAGSTSNVTVVNCNGPRRPKVPKVTGRLRNLSADGSFSVIVRKGSSEKATTRVCTLNIKVLKPK